MNAHDETQAREPRIWTCPTHGTVYGDGERARIQWECLDCQRDRHYGERDFREAHARYGWWRDYSGVPERYRAAAAASIQPVTPSAKALHRLVEAYVGNLQARHESGAGLLLLGPPGLGKTVGLCAIVNAACQKWRGPVYASWPDVLAELKAAFGGKRDDPRRNAIERLRDAPLLALDELGVKTASDFDHAELFTLIDWRYRQQLPTLVATNAGTSSFPALVGERVADRLRETGPTLVLTGDSLRGQVSIAGPDAFPEPPAEIVIRSHRQGSWREDKIATQRDGLL